MKFLIITILTLALNTSIAKAASTENIVVLIPGAASSGDRVYLKGLDTLAWIFYGDYFEGLQKQLWNAGIVPVVCPKDPDDDRRSIQMRSEDCAEQILQKLGGSCNRKSPRNVILVGYSIGGLVARHMASQSVIKDCVQSATLLATPNKGTPLVDYIIPQIQAKTFTGKWAIDYDFTLEKRPYLRELKMDRDLAAKYYYAQDVVDNPKVNYYSISSSLPSMNFASLALSTPMKIVHDEMVARNLQYEHFKRPQSFKWGADCKRMESFKDERLGDEFGLANDGLIPEFSEPYGTYLGHVEVNHFGLACFLSEQDTRQCDLAMKVLVPHLKCLVDQSH